MFPRWEKLCRFVVPLSDNLVTTNTVNSVLQENEPASPPASTTPDVENVQAQSEEEEVKSEPEVSSGGDDEGAKESVKAGTTKMGAARAAAKVCQIN